MSREAVGGEADYEPPRMRRDAIGDAHYGETGPGLTARYRKGIVAVLAALASVAAVVLTGGGWTAVDWITVISGVLGAFGVVLIPNAPKA